MKRAVTAMLLCMVLFIMLIVLNSCVTFNIKNNSTVEKVDRKVYEEFNAYIKEKNFFAAGNSYLEYNVCCSDDKIKVMQDELFELYKVKVGELSQKNDYLALLRYTFSVTSIIGDAFPGSEKEQLTKEIRRYGKKFIDEELRKKGELEKVSWLIYLSKYIPDDPYIYKTITETFIKRKNSILAEKYFLKFQKILTKNKSTQYTDTIKQFSDEIGNLQRSLVKDEGHSQRAIKQIIESSVKIIVDRGLKTEQGMGVPDQILGTGAVIDQNGYIITNYHIIESSVDPKYEGYSRIYVIPGEDEKIKLVAQVVGYDSVYDLALLKVSKKMVSYVKVGDSDTLAQGEQVMAIGNPVGLSNTVTSGIVSSINRPFFQIGNIIQIDAALNPGNSGGALINQNGYLIGIAFAGLENFENLNFAIPSNLLLHILFRLYQKGAVKRSWIGCAVEKIDNNIIVNYIAPRDDTATVLEKNDQIVQVNGITVKNVYDIQDLLSYSESLLIIRLTVEREGKSMVLPVALFSRPTVPSRYVYKHDATENIITPLFGIVMVKVEEAKRKFYSVSRVVSGSPAGEFGVTEGDEIRIKGLKYNEKNKLFYLSLELRSKRFGYISKSIVLYTYEGINSFI